MVHIGHIDYTKLRDLLREAGYTSYDMRKAGTIGQATWQKIMRGDGALSTTSIAALCELLHCQPGDILAYVSDAKEVAQMSGGEEHGS